MSNIELDICEITCDDYESCRECPMYDGFKCLDAAINNEERKVN